MLEKNFMIQRTRFSMWFWLTLILLAGFTLLRTALTVRVWDVIDPALFGLICILGKGLVYDLAELNKTGI